MEPAIRYRKLPGRRRGLFRGSSIWLAPDHLLLVRSMRFREEYKRYQLRDIQAIVVGSAARFHISTRSIGIALLWLVAFLVLRSRVAWISAPMSAVAAALVFAWFLISLQFSCRCRIYTAVSRDELPSLYRTWTARRFLRLIEPSIAEAQGALEGAWLEALSSRTLGPPRSAPPPPPPGITPAPRTPRNRTTATDLLIVALFADALLNATAMNSTGKWIQAANAALALVELGASITAIVEHYHRTLRAAMQRLAIATLIAEGLFYYLRPLIVGIVIGARAASSRTPGLAALPVDPWMREVDAILCALLGLAGLIILMTGKESAEDDPSIITPPA